MTKELETERKDEMYSKIICMDASCSGFIVSVTDSERHIHEVFSSPSKEFRGENLLYVLDRMVEKTGYEKKLTELIITSKGPGSLTGLRIAMSYVKTLAQIFGVKISAVPTLYLLEKSSGIAEIGVPVFLQARKNMYYTRKTGEEPGFFYLADKDEALRIAGESKLSVIETGCDLKSHIGAEKYVLTDISEEKLVQEGLRSAVKNETYRFDELLPEYGGKSVAELLFEKKHKGI